VRQESEQTTRHNPAAEKKLALKASPEPSRGKAKQNLIFAQAPGPPDDTNGRSLIE
jgi:hypothetical protein